MLVTLAYPFTAGDGVKHAPDETVDLPKDTARRLIRDGRARPAVPQPEPDPAPKRTPRPAATSNDGAVDGPSEKEESNGQEF